ncbi:MAG: hypothetical protein E7625_06910 [Ruminococcaceae bacterium]|nr:hypothetical protein [Oscillospiraceae bacterium]
MQKKNPIQSKKSRRFLASLTTWVLLLALLVQALPITAAAAYDGLFDFGGTTQAPGLSSGIGRWDGDVAYDQLKKDLLKSINEDLLMKVEDLEMKGEVGVILTFSDDALINAYSKANTNKTYEEYRSTTAAETLLAEMKTQQDGVLDRLWSEGLITEVKYQYSHIMNGAFVTTTYEQLDAICDIEGVERIMISNTYLPAVAVDNPVNVYDTGIFNSSDISFTGKGTVVSILDTGCDYAHTAFTTHQVVDPKYDRDFIASVLASTRAYELSGGDLEAREVFYGNITGNKIAFGYDYADKDPDIMPFSNNHGTHVAGIIGGKDDVITGVAIDTQFAIMKVFSDYRTGAKDGDILAALEDSVVLGVDAINMSLGTSCGFTREVDEQLKNEIYDGIEAAGISLIVAASNDYSSGMGGEEGNTNKADNPDSATVGSPSTYHAALSVASINGNKDKYMFANGDREVFFHEATNAAADEFNFFEMLGITESNPVQTFEYVTIAGVGMAINYAGLDMTGKIALVQRGDITFEEKVQFAHEAGALAIIIYNNVVGDIRMTVGNEPKIPVVSIGKDDGEAMAAFETGELTFDLNNLAGPFMSDFSSWGPTPSLELKPEITAHGGNILSAIPGGDYDKLSGTSMAAPNMCGIAVLIRQYVIEKYPEYSTTQVRDLVNQLCMSTATIALDRKGNPYSPRKQGAGIADIVKATTTGAYLYVEGIDKTKLELGDDPKRTGVYEMSIQLKNISDAAVSYRLGNITMTETLSSSDPEYVAEMGYLLSNKADYAVENGTLTDGVVSVAAGQTATVKITLTLSDQDKSYLNASFENGMFIEGFITFDNTDEKGVDLNAPFLAFYGDWAEAPIFDLDYYEVETEAHNNAIDEDDKIKADYYATTPLGSYYYDYILPLGAYLYKMDESEYTPIPATREKAAVSYYKNCISGVYGVLTGLLRGAKEMTITVKNMATGEVVWSLTEYNCYKSHAAGGTPRGYFADFDLQMVNTETNEVFGANNTKYEVTMSAKLDWDGGTRNSSDNYSFTFYIDYEAPTITDATFRTEYDKAREENRYYVDVMVYDNHYAQSLRPIIVYDNPHKDSEDDPDKTYATLCEYPIPVYQENRGESTKVSIEITDYIDQIRNSDMPGGITFYIDDYALNSSICYVPFPDTQYEGIEFVVDDLSMDIGQVVDLTTQLARTDNEPIETRYLENLTWTSSDESVVSVHGGKIEAKKSGSATISVTSGTWTQKNGEEEVEMPLYKTIVINVSETTVDDPNSAMNVQIESLKFSGYKTLFAFNSDIDFSEIGETDTQHYFGANPSIVFYPSEKVQLYYSLEPWNLDPSRYTLKWSSSNPKVATIDENGVLTAESEGKARITLQITIDGKTSLLAARCSVEVKSEFIIENRTLIAYKGKGGHVVIPDDEGIMYIGSFAFCHYDMDNKKEVEKDEEGNYDIDDKKTPLSNNTVTSVVIPEGVDTIEKYAFYNCTALTDVTLPESCKTINERAFSDCKVLTNINFDHVQVVSDYSFYQCSSLTGSDIGGINLTHVSSIGEYAFAGSRLQSIDLDNLRRTGKGAFSDCEYLTDVVLGERTRISESMFENSAVKSVVIYSDIIEDKAFKNCTNLTSAQFCTDLTYLGKEAFSGCKKLSTVTFDGACEEMSTLAFYQCESLKTLKLPNGSVALGDSVFAATGLEKLILDKETYLETIGLGAFENVKKVDIVATDSKYYTFNTNALYSKDGTVLVLVQPGNKMVSFTVPAGVKEIGDGAFSTLSTLISVSFESGSKLERIGYAAFAFCPLLQKVELPDCPVAIEEMAFRNVVLLKDINLDRVTYVGDFAFMNTALKSIELKADGVEIGEGAFYGCANLGKYTGDVVTLGAGAVIGNNAFYATPIRKVTLLGDGVTVGDKAFYGCTSLSEFDFDKLTGKVGDYAFYLCVSLTSVNMPNVTELGEGCFADCVGLQEFYAEKLQVVGDKAFAAIREGAQAGATFAEFDAPELTRVGEYAFYGCIYLKNIDLSKVTEIGASAFGVCVSLEKVVLSKDLKELKEMTFYNCGLAVADKHLDINLENVVRFGLGVFYATKLPAKLELTSAEYIEERAFIEAEDKNYLEEVIAPNLKTLGAQAFANCINLKKFSAPKLESIDYAAFAATAIEELEISSSIKKISYDLFDSNQVFRAFYVTLEDGTKSYNFENEDVMICDGVLYDVTPEGYVMTVYPAAKQDKEFHVADGTVRIDFMAALNNKNLETLVLPESLAYIGNYAFYGCENLKTVKFHSYYAPVLEGTMTGKEIDINAETIGDYAGFDKLYRYDYYYAAQQQVIRAFYYANFVDIVTSTKASGLTFVVPESSEGYDSALYLAYFTPSEENTGATTGRYALAFINAAKKLPEVADRFDKALIDAAINAYNALANRKDELAQVDTALVEHFMKVRSEYNISVAENLINHLFDMYSNEYSFEKVKEARAALLALTAEEQARVSNASVLTTKMEELAAAMGVEFDFTKTFAQHFPDEPVVTPPDDPTTPEPDNTGKIIVIVAVSVVVLAAVAVTLVWLLKNKKKEEKKEEVTVEDEAQ